ncbi:MFS transporter [Spiribacter halobius]|uniref:MFS transporter n=1 Tax=Sediminicurvatus halobius TaxID=2182432 RepID=A0A2U2N343_9GAMM|nr:MFS transporter [Spiribacter halobius]PWG63512.1 MFS transporter [Spiribacter halobius]UEX79618.1 MFS transporter [Spiribacter halobius]
MAVSTGKRAGSAAAGVAESAFAPLRHLAFAVLWTATVVSNIGTWMHEVAAGWLMTSLSPSPMLVALVQTATTLPVFLFALPAGALADIVDRRRLLIIVQTGLALTAALLGTLVLAGAMTPMLLLALTFVMGMGAALLAPAWQAIVPRLVPREDLQSAVALNSVGINVSRAVGPAIAGVLIAAVGLWAPFFLNALSFLCVIAALVWWRPAPAPPRWLPPEHLIGALRTGLRYARASVPLRATLARALAFFVFASAYWALLPLIARQLLGGGPTLYGGLLGAVGAGAVGGALLLPRLRARLGADRVVALGTLGTATTLLGFALLREPSVAVVMSLIAGTSWIAVLSSLNVSAQTALPDWVRARGLALFVTVFFGAMSLGSLVWGQLASVAGVPAALLAAAAGAVLAVPVSLRWRLGQGESMDLTPSLHWPAPPAAEAVDEGHGPVLVTVEYDIEPVRTTEFLAALEGLASERRRDGAYAWGIFEDVAVPGRFVESFLVASWLEHLRQHERVTRADAELQARVRAFHRGPDGPVVRHHLARSPGERP